MPLEPTAENTRTASPGQSPDAAGTGQFVAGMVIGPYQLLQLIGEGGMGQVWAAEQLEPVRRRVAIKLIKLGMDTREVVTRFESERRALALMDHPAIAKVFDAGSTPEGRPYFVMEYVAGLPITTYCDRHKLNCRQRMELLVQVCEGVQHAHQKGIIHRDLKPSNILITEVDGKPRPRIIDFGVAKAMSEGVDAETMFTQVGAVIGTLGYMSPEQAGSAGTDVDTRSDVYSLGVVLYELLVGALPVDLKNLTYYEVLRCLREQDAPPPSSRLRALTGDSDRTAQSRGADLAARTRELRGDADAIALKALEKDRKLRYSTPSELAADIDNYLCNEPVTAHAPSFGYLARKYVRRHRVAVLAAVAGILLLVGFALVQTIQLRNTRRQRDRADRITAFMTDMFKVSDPNEARGNTITVREILDKSSNEIESGLGEDASVRSQLMQVMASTYSGLGLYGRAHRLEEQVLQSRQREFGPKDPRTLESMTKMGSILSREGRDVEAENFLRNTIDTQTSVLGPDNVLTLQSQEELAVLLEHQAHYVEAEKLERTVIAAKVRKLGSEDPQTLASRNTLASVLGGESRFDEAERESREVLAIERRTLGTAHPYTLVTMHNLANMLADEGRYEEAEPLYRESLRIERRVLGSEHPDTASTMTSLANTIRFRPGRQAEAEALYRQALAIESRAVGPDHSYTTNAKEGLANNLSSEHQYGEAEQLLREVLSTRQRTVGPNNTDTLLTQYNLAELEFKQHQFDQAEAMIRQTLRTQAHVLDANDPDTLASKTLLARILLEENKPREAEEWARQAFDAQLQTLGPQHSDTQDSLFYLAEALGNLGRYPEAKALYVDDAGKITRLPKGDASATWYSLAKVAADTGHKGDAFEALNQAIQGGYADAERLRTDSDLKALRSDPRFAQTITLAQKQADAAKQQSP